MFLLLLSIASAHLGLVREGQCILIRRDFSGFITMREKKILVRTIEIQKELGNPRIFQSLNLQKVINCAKMQKAESLPLQMHFISIMTCN